MTWTTKADARHVLGPTTGYVVVGLSAFVVLASGPRLLGPDQYSQLAVSWTMVTIVSIGLALPGEQTVTRHVASGSDPREYTRIQLRLLVVAAVIALLVPAAVLGWNRLLDNSVLWSVAVAAAAAAAALTVGPRGLLGGHAMFTGYGQCLSVEGAVRIACCAVAWVLPQWAAVLLALSLVLPQLASAAVGWWLLRAVDHGAHGDAGHWSEQVAFTLVALFFQIVLNTAPLFVQWHSADAAAAGQYVSATTYLRIPLLVTGGLVAVTLSRAAAAHGIGNSQELGRITRRFPLQGTLAAAAMTAVLLVISGPALQLYYGAPISIGFEVLLVLGLATVGTVAANVLTQIVMACRRQRAGSSIWAAAAALTLVLLTALSATLLGASTAVLIGVVTSAVALFLVVRDVR